VTYGTAMLTLMIAICKPFRLEWIMWIMVVLKDTMNQANLPLHLLVRNCTFTGYAYNIPYTTIHRG
jgi:hypothetical protein